MLKWKEGKLIGERERLKVGYCEVGRREGERLGRGEQERDWGGEENGRVYTNGDYLLR